MNEMKLADIKSKTREVLGLSEEVDLDYITQEVVDQDSTRTFEVDEKLVDAALDVREGHNVRYAYYSGEYGYGYERGASQTGAGCGNTVTTWLAFSRWNAQSIGRCTGNDHRVRFTRK